MKIVFLKKNIDIIKKNIDIIFLSYFLLKKKTSTFLSIVLGLIIIFGISNKEKNYPTVMAKVRGDIQYSILF